MNDLQKQLNEPAIIVESLINLRNELYGKLYSAEHNEIFLKINTCLYKTYPLVQKTVDI